jgi:hypothetical protein
MHRYSERDATIGPVWQALAMLSALPTKDSHMTIATLCSNPSCPLGIVDCHELHTAQASNACNVLKFMTGTNTYGLP